MILILASESDEQAQRLAGRWPATVITPTDLSKAGWRFEVPAGNEGISIASGRTISNRKITGVLTRLACVSERDLPHISSEDRAYVAGEMHSFLVAWLDSLDCPVLNRPTPTSLCGTLGPITCSPVEESDESVVVVGENCFGAAEPDHAAQALRIAREAGVDLLEVFFRKGEFVAAGLVPCLSREDASEAVYHFLTTNQRISSKPPVPAYGRQGRSQVLLWGLPADGPLNRVHEELRQMGAPVVLIDQRDVMETEVCACEVRVHGERFPLDAIQSVYLRNYDSTRLPHVRGSSEEALRHAAEVDAALIRWVATTSAFLVSPLDAMSANDSKPYQSRWISTFGWRIPQTLITTDPYAAREFWKQHGSVIYKSISSVRSRVARLTPEHDRRLEDITNCPTQFQEYISGIDYRVHVVGSEVFACQVRSEADDYRYAGDSGAEFHPCQLPPEVEDPCIRMSAAMRLPVSGIDLRLTPEGEWVCFEVNPSPGFSAYEDVTGQPIAAAVARLLLNPS